MNQISKQKESFDDIYKNGSRSHVFTNDNNIKYLVEWRIRNGIKKALSVSKKIDMSSSILILCSGEGLEGSILCDLGFTDVTVSDLTQNGVDAAIKRDLRLKGMVLNAENSQLVSKSYDIVLVQDGLHHLSSPVGGFIEMIRLAKTCVIFFEPHNSIIGRLIGTTWERNGSSVNWVFRWNKDLVQQVASSYLGNSNFKNYSYSFWHHNTVFEKIATHFGLVSVKIIRQALNLLYFLRGNQFCGLIIL